MSTFNKIIGKILGGRKKKSPFPSQSLTPTMNLVDSSNIEAIGYVPKERLLHVKFKGGGMYRYADVPKRRYKQFSAAPSKGKFFAKNIRGKFDFERNTKPLYTTQIK